MATGELAVDRPLGPGDAVLIVGGAGLIGRFVAHRAAAAGLRPLVVARSPAAPGVLPPEAEHLQLDRRALPRAMRDWPPGPLGVVEVLAEGPEEISPLLTATARCPGRFIAIGSASVLGRMPRGRRYSEGAVPAPHTEAMERKRTVERLLAEVHRRGRTTLTLRCAYPYGPGHGPMTPLGRDLRLFEKLDRHREIQWIERGALSPIQPLWAGDLARAIVALLTRAERPGPLYNIAGPRVLSWWKYVEVLARGRWPQSNLVASPLSELLARNPDAWWLRDYLPHAPLLDDSLLRREVFACETRLDETVEGWAEWCAAAV